MLNWIIRRIQIIMVAVSYLTHALISTTQFYLVFFSTTKSQHMFDARQTPLQSNKCISCLKMRVLSHVPNLCCQLKYASKRVHCPMLTVR